MCARTRAHTYEPPHAHKRRPAEASPPPPLLFRVYPALRLRRRYADVCVCAARQRVVSMATGAPSYSHWLPTPNLHLYTLHTDLAARLIRVHAENRPLAPAAKLFSPTRADETRCPLHALASPFRRFPSPFSSSPSALDRPPLSRTRNLLPIAVDCLLELFSHSLFRSPSRQPLSRRGKPVGRPRSTSG